MAPFVKVDTADIRLWGRRAVECGCRTVDELSEEARQLGYSGRSQERRDLTPRPVMDHRVVLNPASEPEARKKILQMGNFLFDITFGHVRQVKLITKLR